MAKSIKKSSGKPTTVSEYISDVDSKVAQTKLKQIRKAVRAAAPKAEEALKWSMPSLIQGRILLNYAAFKNHVSLFPTPSAIKKFSKELSKYEVSKGTIKFPLDQKLPLALIAKIAKFRLKEVLEKDSKWK
jgi:uncharacterized protein YdhG (YjbR/CyaY superfamily)